MANYELGKIGLNLCGDFDVNKSYSKLDVISYNGSSYVATEECVGVYPDALQNNPWMLLARGSLGDAQEFVLEFDSDSSFEEYTTNPLAPTLRVSGNVVEIHGEIKPTKSISGGTTYYSICTVPYDYAPHHDVCVLQQGTTQQIWMLRIFNRDHETHAGKVMFARCRSGSSWSDVGTSTWLPFHATWIV